MSYDLGLKDPKTGLACVLNEPHQMRGGTYQLGGCPTAEFNITYNYSPFFYRVFGDLGIRTLYGMTGEESIPLLEAGMAQLGDDVYPDYWTATEGNAKKALTCLLALAKQCPDGIWDGD